MPGQSTQPLRPSVPSCLPPQSQSIPLSAATSHDWTAAQKHNSEMHHSKWAVPLLAANTAISGSPYWPNHLSLLQVFLLPIHSLRRYVLPVNTIPLLFWLLVASTMSNMSTWTEGNSFEDFKDATFHNALYTAQKGRRSSTSITVGTGQPSLSEPRSRNRKGKQPAEKSSLTLEDQIPSFTSPVPLPS